jgi:hypothetical protein
MSDRFYHGGKPGLGIGDFLVPSPPHIYDGCPICVARAEGRIYTVGEFRTFLKSKGEIGKPGLRMLAGADDSQPVDPPSAENAVYVTTELDYARWYAARSRGDLYRVEPIGPIARTTEDNFPSFTTPMARIVEVVERRVVLTRRSRRALFREWGKRDKMASAAR